MAYCRLTEDCDLYVYLSDTCLICGTCDQAYFKTTKELIQHIVEDHEEFDLYPDDLITRLEVDAEFNDEYIADTDPDKFNKAFEAGKFDNRGG